MSIHAQVHEEKYQLAKAQGLPGWGGAGRIEKLPDTLKERFFSFAGLPRSGRVLELGCGAGNLSIEIASHGYDVSGVDFSPTAISWAVENAKERNISADFSLADVTNLSRFAECEFEIVYDGNCLHCVTGEKRNKALAECHRVLKLHGILFISSLCAQESDESFPVNFNSQTRILSESNIPYRCIPTPEVIQGEVQNMGFEILNVVVRPESPFGHINIHAKKI